MVCLGIDTSGEILSVGLSSHGEVLGERIYQGKNPHSVMIIAEIEALLSKTHIDLKNIGLIAATAGPGRYTALRVGIATAKGLAMARGIPLVRVSALEALIYSLLPHEGPICALLDARRRLVYFARFEASGDRMQRKEADHALSYHEAASLIPQRALLVGNGVSLIQPLLKERGVNFFTRQTMTIHGGNVAKLGEVRFHTKGKDELYEGPTYIREVEIHKAFPTTQNR